MTSPSERDHEVADAARMYVLAVKRLDGACGELIAAPLDDPNEERLRDDVRLAEAAHDHLKARLLREAGGASWGPWEEATYDHPLTCSIQDIEASQF